MSLRRREHIWTCILDVALLWEQLSWTPGRSGLDDMGPGQRLQLDCDSCQAVHPLASTTSGLGAECVASADQISLRFSPQLDSYSAGQSAGPDNGVGGFVRVLACKCSREFCRR